MTPLASPGLPSPPLPGMGSPCPVMPASYSSPGSPVLLASPWCRAGMVSEGEVTCPRLLLVKVSTRVQAPQGELRALCQLPDPQHLACQVAKESDPVSSVGTLSLFLSCWLPARGLCALDKPATEEQAALGIPVKSQTPSPLQGTRQASGEGEVSRDFYWPFLSCFSIDCTGWVCTLCPDPSS